MDHRWPLSAGMPATAEPSFSRDLHRDEVHSKKAVNIPPRQSDDVDPRVLFATRFWGKRRFSDSFSQLPHALTAQALNRVNHHDRGGSRNEPPHILTGPFPLELDLPPTPISTQSFHSPRPCLQQHILIHHIHHHYHHYLGTASPPRSPAAPALAGKQLKEHMEERKQTGFLRIPGYTPHTIHPRSHIPLPPSRRDELADALGQIEIKTGAVTVKGVGHLARPLLVNHNKAGLNSFLGAHTRTLLVPRTLEASFRTGSDEGAEEHLNGMGGGGGQGTAGSNKRRGEGGKGGGITKLGQRELRMLESELFDVGKFLTAGEGGVGGRYLTVLTWSEGAAYGTVTLFEVEVEEPRPPMRTAAVVAGGGLAARRRFVPAPLDISSRRGKVTGIRPVASMEDVPRQVLVSMRLDQGVKKAVLQHDRVSGRFRWTAQHTRRGPPSYARVFMVEEFCEVRTATGTGFDDNHWRRGNRRARRRDARQRVRSTLGVDDARNTVAHRGTEAEHMAQQVDGVVATIPQFLALLHASRSVIEKASSTAATAPTVKPKEGEMLRAVVLDRLPCGTRHGGRDVHIAVLVPDGAKWADERIFWTDDQGGLAELREKKYRNVIGSERLRENETRGRGYEGDWGVRNLSLSPPLCPKTARW